MSIADDARVYPEGEVPGLGSEWWLGTRAAWEAWSWLALEIADGVEGVQAISPAHIGSGLTVRLQSLSISVTPILFGAAGFSVGDMGRICSALEETHDAKALGTIPLVALALTALGLSADCLGEGADIHVHAPTCAKVIDAIRGMLRLQQALAEAIAAMPESEAA